MLRRLTISNYALIDSVELEFERGLTVITGETGSGKSIMLGALSLLTGARADVKSLSEGGRKAIVEAEFHDVAERVARLAGEADSDSDKGVVILRREILSSGRSRAFVNDSPVTLQVLSEIASALLDIHSQHSNIVLSRPEMQLGIIDAFARNRDVLDDYRETFTEFVAVRSKVKKLKAKIEEERKNRDFVTFQLEQLDKISPKRGELAKVEKEYDLLSAADEIGENIARSFYLLEGGERSVVDGLEETASLLEGIEIEELAEGELSLCERLNQVCVEVKDIAETVRDWSDRVHSDPVRLSKLSARMNLLYESLKRFKVADEDGLVKLQESLRERLSLIDGGDDSLSELEKRGRSLAVLLKSKAEKLTATRQQGALRLKEELTTAAMPLGLPNLQFEVKLIPGKLGHDGQESVEFMTSFNKSRELQPMSKIASGGELARIMLALKSVMAREVELPTVIFDEIDTGVSGEIADKMGKMMEEMGGSMQVMAVTHLPQVAARGKSHFKVYKTDEEHATVTHVKALGKTEREREIAAMMSGSDINHAAIANARALMGKGKKI